MYIHYNNEISVLCLIQMTRGVTVYKEELPHTMSVALRNVDLAAWCKNDW